MEMSSEDEDISYDSDIDVDSNWSDSTSSDSKVAEDVDDEPSSLQWLSRLQRKSEKSFKGPTPGPKQPVSATNSPLHVFCEICPESIFELRKSTNDYIPIYTARRQKTDPVWTEKVFKPVTAEVMKAYVGIRMIMGINQKNKHRGLLVYKPFAKKY